MLRFCGLLNLDNSCYANSCLQALYTLNKTRNQVLSNPQAGTFHSLLCNLFKRMSNGPFLQIPPSKDHPGNLAISPDEFIATFREYRPEFQPGQENDAQEFLYFLLEALHQEVNEARKAKRPTVSSHQTAAEAWKYYNAFVDNSTFSRIFLGQLESTVTCLSCDHQSKTWNCFWQLQLGIPSRKSPSQATKHPQNGTEEVFTIKDCLAEFMEEEKLTADEAPTCPSCQRKLGSTKKQVVCQGPVYLIVHLKRFAPTGNRIDSKVSFDERLLLANRYYWLSCCVLHNGSAQTGHYVTIHREEANHWVVLNDERVFDKVPEEQVKQLLSDYGYIGFYRAIVL